MMRMEAILVFLMFLGTINCQKLILTGRPFLHHHDIIINQVSTVTKGVHHELKVAASADDIWGVYSSPDLAKHLPDLLPGAFEKLEIIGDGGVGTILDMTFPPGEFPHEYKEKFILVDNVHRLKKVQMIEGGYLDLGVTYYMDTIQVLPTGTDSCIIISSTEYHVKPEFVKIVEPLITTGPLAAMADAISKLVLAGKHISNSDKIVASITTI
ncbi:S-norcoclaurine synthase [Thalictrum thalictroides]|uniref:S-norcoclaurine synthase n=1 Tax=Thalictrum thalictroides TaxID=46969 RepID=A0A7J6WT74_THATH|nr:S-norcoclaurine synthase [Thalictrum thalictroides]